MKSFALFVLFASLFFGGCTLMHRPEKPRYADRFLRSAVDREAHNLTIALGWCTGELPVTFCDRQTFEGMLRQGEKLEFDLRDPVVKYHLARWLSFAAELHVELGGEGKWLRFALRQARYACDIATTPSSIAAISIKVDVANAQSAFMRIYQKVRLEQRK